MKRTLCLLPRVVAAALPAALCLVPVSALAQFVTPGDPGAAPVSAPPSGPVSAPASKAASQDSDRRGGQGVGEAEWPAGLHGSPVGLWRTIDDRTGRARSLVRITDPGNGVLVGTVEKFLEAVPHDALCLKCDDDRRNLPVLGLEIIRGLKPRDGYWADGRILNPEDGKIYHLKATPIDGGQKLEMRGYIGMPLFGRTQVWIREP